MVIVADDRAVVEADLAGGRLSCPCCRVGVLGGWVRFWHLGKLLPLPADLQRELDAARQRIDELQQRLEAAEREDAFLAMKAARP